METVLGTRITFIRASKVCQGKFDCHQRILERLGLEQERKRKNKNIYVLGNEQHSGLESDLKEVQKERSIVALFVFKVSLCYPNLVETLMISFATRT